MTWERGAFLAGVGVFIYTTVFAVIEFTDVVLMVTALT